MSNTNENKLVPKLRFPEFVNDGAWKGDELGKLSVFFKGKGLAKNDIVNRGENPCVHYGELFTNYSEIIKEIKSYTNLSGGFKSEVNDVLMPTSDVTPNGLAKASCIKLDGIILGGDILVIRPNPNIYGEFLSRFIRHRERDVLKLVSGTTVFHLYGSSFEKFRVLYPLIKEQQIIAACLSSLDEVISAESQKLDILRDHKKGLLQNLFPQESETVPKFRFKEFEDSGVWEEKRLDDICKFIRGPFGGALKKKIFVSEGYAVYEQSHAIYGDFTSFRYFITIEKYNELKRFAVQPNDIIMSCSGTMGKFAIVPQQSKKGVINQALLKLTVKTGNDTDFIKASLELPLNQNKLLSQSAGGAIKNVVEVAQIKEINISIPSLSEQEIIADTLSLIDDLINAQRQKVEALKLHKKGLLQGLFPRING